MINIERARMIIIHLISLSLSLVQSFSPRPWIQMQVASFESFSLLFIFGIEISKLQTLP